MDAPAKLQGVRLRTIDTMSDVAEFKTWLSERRPVLGFDLETTGLDWWSGSIRTFQFGDAHTGWFARYDMWRGVLDEVMHEYTGAITGHNVLCFDLLWLWKAGMRPDTRNWDDTLPMSHVYRAEGRHSLKSLSDTYIDPRASVLQKELDDGMRKNGWGWDTVPVDYKPYVAYSALDGPLAALLWEHLSPRRNPRSVYEIERQVSLAAAGMMFRGLPLDVEYTKKLSQNLADTAERELARCREEWGVTPSKTDECSAALLKQGAPLTAKTASGRWKLDKDVLEGLAPQFPLAQSIIAYKQAVKFRTAYAEKALSMVDADGRVHASINTLGAITGRMSVNGLPVQQLPAGRADVRRMIAPTNGAVLVSVDQSNIEMRTVAHLSGERHALDAFHRGEDVHQYMANIVFPGDRKGRKKVKTVSFSKIYGSGAAKMAVTLGASLEHAKEIIAAYDRTFPDLADWTLYVRKLGAERLRNEGRAYITLPSGRQLALDDNSAKANAFYKLCNYAGQGLAAAIMKEDMVSLDMAGLLDYALMPVHDEILFEVPADMDPADFAEAVQDVMNHEAGYPLSCPIATDAEIYPNSWGDCVPDADGTSAKLSVQEYRSMNGGVLCS